MHLNQQHMILRLHGDLFLRPQPGDPDHDRIAAEMDAHQIAVNPVNEPVILIRYVRDPGNTDDEWTLEVDASPFEDPRDLAATLIAFAHMLASGDTIGVSIPNFPPDPEDQP